MTNALSINSQRLQQFIDQFALIGKTAHGGVTRLTLTDEDKQARDFFVQLTRAAGCQVRIDAIGNIFARRAGRQPELPIVMTGSHGDSQPQGGRFDGIYGVLAGLEVLYSLNDHHIETQRSIELVMWTNEEGARFAPAMLGSAVYCGNMPLAQALNIPDSHGILLGDELVRIGYNGHADTRHETIHAAIELHIEQGPVLEKNNKLAGAVTAAMGQKWYEVTFTGMAAHAGTTPMDYRKDALLGLAQGVLAVNQIGLNEMPDGRATVGMTRITPNSRNVVAAEAFFSVEFRHPSQETLERMDKALHEMLATIAKNQGLSLKINPILSLAPVAFDTRLVNKIQAALQELAYPQEDMISGAGHDACNLNKIAPTAMIFIPCIEGISHNERENIKPEWATAGANALLHTLLNLANEAPL